MAEGTSSNGAESAVESGMAQETKQEEQKAVRPLRKAAQDKYPDFSPEDENEWNDKEDEVFNEMSEYNKSYKDAESKLDELISSDDELAGVLNDMVVNKTPFRVAIAKYYSQEDLIPVEGDEDYEGYQKAYEERVSKKEKRSKMDAEIASNEQASLDAIDAFAQEHDMDEEAKTSFINFINDIFNDMLYKKLTPEILNAFYNSMNHDSDVQSAAEAAEIKGRNANIEAQYEEEERKEKGDGLPVTEKGAAAEPEEGKKEERSMLDDVIGARRRF